MAILAGCMGHVTHWGGMGSPWCPHGIHGVVAWRSECRGRVLWRDKALLRHKVPQTEKSPVEPVSCDPSAGVDLNYFGMPGGPK